MVPPAPLIARTLLLVIVTALAMSCASRPFEHYTVDSVPFTDRAESREAPGVRVSVAVPSEEETRKLFSIPLYDRGIQPVWIEVENRGDSRLRYAPVGTDPNYFSPLEVAYMFRSGFSKSARTDMERYFHDTAMARFIPPGTTRSGFVYTHASVGTKDVTVDLFGNRTDASFTFLVQVPGFEPDHAEIDPQRIYSDDEIEDVDIEELADVLRTMDCCASDESGEPSGDPVNIVFIGGGAGILGALLRADWNETLRPRDDKDRARRDQGQYLFGRTADAVFRRRRGKTGERNELRVWLAPQRLDGERVWLAQVTHLIVHEGRGLLDPDMDDARSHLLQSLWYAQSVNRYGWVKGPESIDIEEPRQGTNGAVFFTDGYRALIWIGDEPVSLLESEHADLDVPPRNR